MFAPRRVLILSSHPLFGQGLRRLLQNRPGADVDVIGIVNSIDAAKTAIQQHEPDLIVVDYDDEAVNREAFLAHFVVSGGQLRVVLFSLKEGGSEAIVYDRRSMSASQVDDWLKTWTDPDAARLNSSQVGGTPVQLQQVDPKPFDGDKTPGVDKGMENKPFGKKIDPETLKHLVGAAIFVIVLSAIGLLILRNDLLLPAPASVQAGPIDQIFNLHWKLIAFLFALIAGTIFYSLIVFRRKPGDTSDAEHITGNTRLEIAWTAIPLAIVIGLSLVSASALAQTQRIDPQALEVNVTGLQWAWRFEYPDSGIISTELVLPVNRQVLLRLVSLDVIHSFWVPEFRLKQDAVPGQEKILRVTPDKIGVYTMMCAEVCGTLHAQMVSTVRVVSETDYNAWVAGQAAAVSQDPAALGQTLAEASGCLSCHSIDGAPLIGPTFKGLFGKTETFEDGSSLVVDEAYLFEAIRQPMKSVVQGYAPIMQESTSAQLSDEQIQAIVDYIKSVK